MILIFSFFYLFFSYLIYYQMSLKTLNFLTIFPLHYHCLSFYVFSFFFYPFYPFYPFFCSYLTSQHFSQCCFMNLNHCFFFFFWIYLSYPVVFFPFLFWIKIYLTLHILQENIKIYHSCNLFRSPIFLLMLSSINLSISISLSMLVSISIPFFPFILFVPFPFYFTVEIFISYSILSAFNSKSLDLAIIFFCS